MVTSKLVATKIAKMQNCHKQLVKLSSVLFYCVPTVKHYGKLYKIQLYHKYDSENVYIECIWL